METMHFGTPMSESKMNINMYASDIKDLKEQIRELSELVNECRGITFEVNVDIGVAASGIINEQLNSTPELTINNNKITLDGYNLTSVESYTLRKSFNEPTTTLDLTLLVNEVNLID